MLCVVQVIESKGALWCKRYGQCGGSVGEMYVCGVHVCMCGVYMYVKVGECDVLVCMCEHA